MNVKPFSVTQHVQYIGCLMGNILELL